jgi:hypothetical protein
VQRDVTRDGLPDGTHALVACAYFLDRGLWRALREAVAPGGVVAFETFTLRHVEATAGAFPRAYALEPGELPAAFAGFDVLVHEGADAEVERLVARCPA